MFFSLVHGHSTFGRGEEVEEGVVGDRLGDRPHGAAALVLLFLLDGFQRDVLALRPVNGAAEGCLQRRAVTLTIGPEAVEGGAGSGGGVVATASVEADSPCAADDLGAVEGEGVRLVRLGPHLVGFCQHCVCEEVVG